jgi:hypothetical protein
MQSPAIVDRKEVVRCCLPSASRDPGSQAIEPNKQQPVDAAEDHSLRAFAPQDVELMPKYKVFGFQRSARAEQPDQGVPEQPAKIAHRWNYDQFAGVTQLF